MTLTYEELKFPNYINTNKALTLMAKIGKKTKMIHFTIPDIAIQKEIVKEYNTIINRIEINNLLIRKSEETAQAIYKKWFIDFEFPDENGNPYKSSNGEMEYNEELDQDIPKGWKVNSLKLLSHR